MSILRATDDRADWLARVHSLTLALQALETSISIAMLDRPQRLQIQTLLLADTQLGIAANALDRAASQIRGLA